MVVGVDGSAGAREALRWAAAEARLRRTPLRVVHATTPGFFDPGGAGHGYPYIGGYGYPYVVGSMEPRPSAGFDELREAAERFLDRVIADGETFLEGLEIERRVVVGGAVDALVSAVAERDLLVVGSRGHGGFAGLLLGSVSQQCAHHAPCPVVIVHAPKASSGSNPAGPVQTESGSAA